MMNVLESVEETERSRSETGQTVAMPTPARRGEVYTESGRARTSPSRSPEQTGGSSARDLANAGGSRESRDSREASR